MPAMPVTMGTRQLVVVRSSSWYAASGILELFAKDASRRWVRAGTEVPVSLGRNGMGWARGIHPPQSAGPVKKEGDGRSPAGVFSLHSAFGIAEALPSGAHGFPYLQTLSSTYCVEDVRSDHYNQIIDSNDVTRTSWEKWSELRRADGLFTWGIIVRQNAPETIRGAGSCVFLHVWRGPRLPTAGCTAMPREEIEGLLRWLAPDAAPLLVQLPRAAYEELRAAWALP
jgi:L,D-peptidoglycan transpeptidase YkuD (ErfK/YbiS/YcfS/YnhG family)